MKKLSVVPVSCVCVSREPERGVCVCVTRHSGTASSLDTKHSRETQQKDLFKREIFRNFKGYKIGF